jgi:hypothetical protein
MGIAPRGDADSRALSRLSSLHLRQFQAPHFCSPSTAQIDEISKEALSSKSTWVSEITPKKPLLHLPLREIWRYRDLIALSIWRDFISLHKQTIFAPLWVLRSTACEHRRLPGGFRQYRAASHQ